MVSVIVYSPDVAVAQPDSSAGFSDVCNWSYRGLGPVMGYKMRRSPALGAGMIAAEGPVVSEPHWLIAKGPVIAK